MACMMHMPGSIKGEFSGAANPFPLECTVWAVNQGQTTEG